MSINDAENLRIERIKNASLKIEASVSSFFKPDTFINYLNLVAKLHHYTADNLLLINMQKPNATHIEGFNTWKTLGRNIKKDEKAIVILSPSQSGDHIVYNIVGVFDVSQTEGQPVYQIKTGLTMDSFKTRELFNSLRSCCPCSISFISAADNPLMSVEKVFYDNTKQRIYIRDGMDDLQTLKAGIYGWASYEIHKANSADIKVIELQTEAVLFAVCDYFGINVAEYTFSYIEAWSYEKTPQEMLKILRQIQETAEKIIDEAEPLFIKKIKDFDLVDHLTIDGASGKEEGILCD